RPVARHMDLDDADTRLLARRESGPFKFGHRLHRTHVGPNEPGTFVRRIGLVLDLLRQAALRWLRRHFDDVAFHIYFPAVVEAAQPAFFVPAIDERGAPMRTIFIEHAD